jgi:hypothetical protein
LTPEGFAANLRCVFDKQNGQDCVYWHLAMSKQIRKMLGAVLGFSLFVAMTAINILDFRHNGPIADRIKEELDQEMSLIKAPPQSTLNDHRSSSKPRLAIQMLYDTTLDYSPIRAHYDAELSSHGWKYMHEEHLGSRIKRCYSKGEYLSVLTYNEALFDQTFSISMSWGMSLCD